MGNIAVNMITGTPIVINRNNSCIFGWKSTQLSKIVWHLSITIRSNQFRSCNRPKYDQNLLLTADLGVTNTIRAVSGG
jgi:hypothetical protein